jgi:hypothetical protein
VSSGGVLWGVLQGVHQVSSKGSSRRPPRCPSRGSSRGVLKVSKVSSREDTLPILFIYQKLYSLDINIKRTYTNCPPVGSGYVKIFLKVEGTHTTFQSQSNDIAVRSGVADLIM